MSEDRLKPCPFCGGQVEIAVFTAEEDGSRQFGVTCAACGLYADFSDSVGEGESARQETIAAWNRRA